MAFDREANPSAPITEAERRAEHVAALRREHAHVAAMPEPDEDRLAAIREQITEHGGDEDAETPEDSGPDLETPEDPAPAVETPERHAPPRQTRRR